MEQTKAGQSVWKIYLPNVHAAEAMAEALSIQGYKAGWAGKDYIVGLECAEFDAVVEVVKRHHHHFHAVRVDKDGVEPPPFHRYVSKEEKTDLTCWNCGKAGTVLAESVDETSFRCSACGAWGNKEDY